MQFDTTKINNMILNTGRETNFSRAYIVEEKETRVREAFVEKLASILECEETDSALRPCGQCASCRQIAKGTSMDIVHMEMTGKNSYKTDDATAMMERLRLGSYGKHVIGIIDDADSLTEIIQNKLLKTLEEPERGVVIILGSSNKSRLLKTIQSRCITIRVRDYTEEYEDETDAEMLCEALETIMREESFFYEKRNVIAKNIKTRQDAEKLIGMLEDEYRYNMIHGTMREEMADMIDIAEEAVKDIKRGMDYSKALKRLILEIQ